MTNSTNNVDMKRVHEVLLRTGKCITEILERHSIPYMLAYGTLLGAVRHKGFIPWDDDFDLMLFGDTYEQAMNFLRAELPDDLFLEDEKSEPLFFHAWPRVKDMNTEASYSLFPQDTAYSHHGLSVDLFIARKVQMCDLSKYRNDENFAYLQRRKSKRLITPEDYSHRMEKLQQSCNLAAQENITDTHEVFALLGRCSSLEIEEVLPLKKYQFEDTEFFGPAKPEVILQKIYGDFMKLPPVEERAGHYSSVEFF